MCFSAPASFVAGGALTGVGIATLKKAKSKQELPFASIPLLFGLQQLAEGAIWIAIGASATSLQAVATYTFVFFAYILWPTMVPAAVLAIETVPWRRKVLWPILLLGMVISGHWLRVVVTEPISSEIIEQHVAYLLPQAPVHWLLGTILYVTATCISSLLSSHKMVNLFGILVLASLAATILAYAHGRVSIWCFFAALTSIVIFVFFLQRSRKTTTQLA